MDTKPITLPCSLAHVGNNSFFMDTQEVKGLIVPGTKRHARLFEVRTHYVCMPEAIICFHH